MNAPRRRGNNEWHRQKILGCVSASAGDYCGGGVIAPWFINGFLNTVQCSFTVVHAHMSVLFLIYCTDVRPKVVKVG